MGKIAPVSAKYIIHSNIQIEGVVDRPDVIGAIFGQTEGLLGSDLELRELQRSGRIGRIEVNTNTSGGKTAGEITIPSSLDKAETCIVAAALEVIQRIGPCNAKLEVKSIEDVRISKRTFVIERAKKLLQELTETTLPDSQELADEVTQSVRIMEITEYGKDRLPAGPAVDESDEVIVVEGRADVMNLLKHGFKNAIALNGTSVPESVKELCGKKIVTVFVDGDRGGDLIIRELMTTAEIDFVCKAPDGKEVEELAKKEIHKALRGKVATEQIKMEIVQRGQGGSDDMMKRPILRSAENSDDAMKKPVFQRRPPMMAAARPSYGTPRPQVQQPPKLNPTQKEKFKSALDDLFGTRGAYLFDKDLNVLGKVPVSEVAATVKSLGNIFAIVMDGPIERDFVKVAERTSVQYLVSMESRMKGEESKVNILTDTDLV